MTTDKIKDLLQESYDASKHRMEGEYTEIGKREYDKTLELLLPVFERHPPSNVGFFFTTEPSTHFFIRWGVVSFSMETWLEDADTYGILHNDMDKVFSLNLPTEKLIERLGEEL